MAPVKQELHELIDRLSEEQARELLKQLRSWLEEEPPLTPEEIADSEAAWREYQAGQGKPLEQVIREQLHERPD